MIGLVSFYLTWISIVILMCQKEAFLSTGFLLSMALLLFNLTLGGPLNGLLGVSIQGVLNLMDLKFSPSSGASSPDCQCKLIFFIGDGPVC